MSRRPGRKRERKFWRRRKRGLLSRTLGSFAPGGRGSKMVSEASVSGTSGSRGKAVVSVPVAVESAERWVRRSNKSKEQPKFRV